ncbi:MAG: hypothetical protein Q3994_06730, partial [Prevotella sp.]|nr:hypothetical protein [Prevotella sp.]
DEFKVQYFSGLGYLLENPEGNYELSSQIAHKLFSNGADMLVTTSLKSDGKEMNFTFRQDVTDNYLEMTTVYECELTESCNPSVPNIHKIGVLINGSVVWHEWKVIPESVQLRNPQPQNRKIVVPNDELLKKENLSQLRPNPMWHYHEVHTSYMYIDSTPILLSSK